MLGPPWPAPAAHVLQFVNQTFSFKPPAFLTSLRGIVTWHVGLRWWSVLWSSRVLLYDLTTPKTPIVVTLNFIIIWLHILYVKSLLPLWSKSFAVNTCSDCHYTVWYRWSYHNCVICMTMNETLHPFVSLDLRTLLVVLTWVIVTHCAVLPSDKLQSNRSSVPVSQFVQTHSLVIRWSPNNLCCWVFTTQHRCFRIAITTTDEDGF